MTDTPDIVDRLRVRSDRASGLGPDYLVLEAADEITRLRAELAEEEAGPCKHWLVLVQTEGGTTSLLRDLTKGEADEVAKRSYNRPMPASGQTITYHSHPGMVDAIDVFHVGPDCPEHSEQNHD